MGLFVSVFAHFIVCISVLSFISPWVWTICLPGQVPHMAHSWWPLKVAHHTVNAQMQPHCVAQMCGPSHR
jgi:hypothetical protein